MVEFFNIKTCHGTILGTDPQNALLAHAPSHELGTLLKPVVAARLAGVPNHCFVSGLGGRSSRIGCWPDPYHAPILAFRLYALGQSSAALMTPITRKFLSAHPPGEGNGRGGIIADATNPLGWQAFEFRPISEIFVPAGAEQAFEPVAQLLSAESRVGAIKRLLWDGEPAVLHPALDSILPMLTDRELQDVAALCLGDERLAERLSQVLDGDLWAAGLVALSRKLRDDKHEPPLPKRLGQRRRLFGLLGARTPEPSPPPAQPQPGGRRQVGVELSSLATAGYSGVLQSFGHACATRSRRSVAPKRRTCIIATARNEGVYLLEWIAYHRSIGVEHFFLYTNNNEDGSDELLGALADAGAITWLDNLLVPGGNAQHKAYGHAFSILPDTLDYAWALVIDIDEFLVFNPAFTTSLNDFLDWHETQSVDAIALNWVMIGSSPSGRWQDQPLHERCLRQFGPDTHIKTIFRPGRVIHSGAHHPIADIRSSLVFRAPDGTMHSYGRNDPVHPSPAFSDTPSQDFACIYHYFFKSAEEYMWKFSRNRGDYALQAGISTQSLDAHFLQSFMAQHRSGGLENNRINRCAPGFARELSTLRTIRGVADAEFAVKQRLAGRSAEVLAAFAASPTLLEAGPLGKEFLQLAGGSLPLGR
jgi:Glycosyl transferase family 2